MHYHLIHPIPHVSFNTSPLVEMYFLTKGSNSESYVAISCYVPLFSRSIKGQLFEGTVNEAWTREGVHIHAC